MPKEGDVYFAIRREYDENGKITVQRFLDCYIKCWARVVINERDL